MEWRLVADWLDRQVLHTNLNNRNREPHEMFYFITPTTTRSICTSVMMLFASVTNAQSEAFCSTLKDITTLPSEHTQTVTSAEFFSKSDLELSEIDHQSNCDISLSGQYLLTCTWHFPYRAAHATERFDRLRTLSAKCANDPAEFTKDQNVNHPDYYEAYYFDFNENTLSVSIKDKAALQETLVFLRVK